MKAWLVFIFSCVFLNMAQGQSRFRCAFSGPTVKPVETVAVDEEEEFYEELIDFVMEEILNEIGINTDGFWAYPATNVRNFQAEYDPVDEEFKMYYSFTFVDNLYNRLGDKRSLMYAIYVISAHEAAHHLNGDVHSAYSSPEKELYADYFAGKQAVRHGIPFESAIKVYQLCTSIGETDTHPGRADRIEAFTIGFEEN